MSNSTSPKPEKALRISFIQNENIIAVVLVIISFSVYLATMSRSVGFTDSGELATVICTLGIAHPTGYPMFTLLGRCWMLIPLPMEQILQLNIFAALLTAIAVGIFFKTALIFHRVLHVFPFKNKWQKEITNNQIILTSAAGSLITAFSTTFWAQSAAIEVYSLHLVFLTLSIFLVISGLEEQINQPGIFSRKLILSIFVLGASFSNHMTTILLVPGIAWLFFCALGMNKESFRKILFLVPSFLLGLSVYLYLPIRSAANPLLDWGHPANLDRFFWHISGKQFRIWMFSGLSVVQKQLSHFVSDFTSEFQIVIVILIVIGIYELFRHSRRLFTFLIILFLSTILYAVNYDIFDIDSYFLLCYLVSGWLAVFGLDFISMKIAKTRNWIYTGAAVCIFILPAIQILYHRNLSDESRNYLPQKFVSNAFSNLDSNAVVLATQWDYFISPSIYYQKIRNQRRDITIIDKSLMQNRSWYFMQLQRQSPDLMMRVKPSVDLFLKELDKFERDIPFNINIIQSYWQNLLNEIVIKSIPDHPVYIDARIDREFSPLFYRIPAGLFLRITDKLDTTFYRTARADFGIWDKKQPVANDFEQYYILMLLREADWLYKRGRADESKAVLNEVLKIEPSNFSARWLLDTEKGK